MTKHKSVSLKRPDEMGVPDIDSFMTGSIGDVQSAGFDLKAIRLDRIIPDPNQPRRDMPTDTLEDLAASIREQGVLQPIEVDYDAEQDVYVLVHGERRWRAAEMAGLETIPAIIKPTRLDRATRLIRQLIENIQREDLNAVDRARALVSLRDQMQGELDARLAEGMEEEATPADKTSWKTRVTWADVGTKVGLSRSRMTRLRALLDLPDDIREDVRAGVLSEYDSRVYRGLPPDQQRELHQARKAQGLTPDQVQGAASLLKASDPAEAPRSVDEALILVTTPPPPKPRPVEAVPTPPPVAEPRPEAAVIETPLPEAAPAPTPPSAETRDAVLRVLASLPPLDTLRLLTRALLGLDLGKAEVDDELRRALAALGKQLERLQREAEA